MIIEITKAFFFAGIPIAWVSYYLIKLLNEVEKKQDQATQPKTNVRKIIYNKYLKFGGGFYGVVAFITYIHVEIYQVIDFIGKFTSISDFIDRIGFGMIVNFFLEAIMNFIQAITWPIYWHKYLPIGSFAIWIIVGIVAHSAATKFALKKYPNQQS